MRADTRRTGYALAACCLLAGGALLAGLVGLYAGAEGPPPGVSPVALAPLLGFDGGTEGAPLGPPAGPELAGELRTTRPHPRPGAPRSWEGGMRVSTYSAANLYNGNLLTVIPITGWSGKGPALSMALYHNSANVLEDQELLTRGMGFDLGPGWTTSYSGQVYRESLLSIEAMVIEDDGTRNVFTLNGGVWEAPAGVFDTLTEDLDGWTLTRKDQSYRRFDVDGLLLAEGDSAGNELAVTRAAGHITVITDAAERTLAFQYDDIGSNGLVNIFDDDDGDENAADRTWSLASARPDDDWLETVTLVMDRTYQNTVTYDGVGRIASVSDWEQRAYSYEYYASGNNAGRLQYVTDPTPVGGGYALSQTFWYISITTTSYRDRRDNYWVLFFNTSGELIKLRNPLNQEQQYGYGVDHNLITFRDELARVWAMQYDPNGNLTDAWDPPGSSNHRQWVYDQYNNLTSFTDSLGNTTAFTYDLPADPTALTKITEPPAGQDNPAAETNLTYYSQDNHPDWKGLLATVTDANGVTTEFDYDWWGQPAAERQGFAWNPSHPTVYPPDTEQVIFIDSGHRIRGGCRGRTCGEIGYGDSWPPGEGDRGDRACGTWGRYASCSLDCRVQMATGEEVGFTESGGREFEYPLGPPVPPIPLGWPTAQECGDFPMELHGWSATYTAMGEPVQQFIEGVEGATRLIEWRESTEGNPPAYDEFGRPTRMTINSDGEWADGVQRSVYWSYDDAQGCYHRWDQDGNYATIVLDAANRVASATFEKPGFNAIGVTYTYYANGLVQYATNSNGTRTYYQYDPAGRLTHLRHELTDGSGYLKDFTYTYYANGWLASITEDEPCPVGEMMGEGAFGAEAEGGQPPVENHFVTQFSYDTRGRLTGEARDGEMGGFCTTACIYDLTYRYDQLGNRTYKKNQRTKLASKYYYDVNPPPAEDYGSHSNRLMKYENYIDVAAPGNEENWVLDETVWYYYDNEGNVTRIARKFERAGQGRDLTQVRSTRFVYNSGGLVEYVIGETFKVVDRLEWVRPEDGLTEYALTPEEMTWANARTYAQSRGGDLVSLGWMAEDFIWEQFKPKSGTAHYWVGAQQASWGPEPAGAWSWLNGWPIFPDDWLSGQPDDGGGQNHDVAEYVVDADGWSDDDGLDDQDGLGLRYGIIQRPTAAACDDEADLAYDFHRTYAWQFRYDTARARYMRRMLDPDTLEPDSTEWSDYDGDEVVGDFTIETSPSPTHAQQQRLYFGGVAHVDVDENNNWTDAGFYHDNHLGSTEVLSDPSGDVTRRIVYTAFGEPANLWPGAPEGAAQTRYLYAGAWGYESDAALPFLDVGYRYYYPETGRFLQRDPIGIRGGLNTYEYMRGKPTGGVDPLGLWDLGYVGLPQANIPDPPRGLPHMSLEQQRDEELFKAWVAGTCLGGIGLMGPTWLGIGIFALDAGAGLYAVWPI